MTKHKLNFREVLLTVISTCVVMVIAVGYIRLETLSRWHLLRAQNKITTLKNDNLMLRLIVRDQTNILSDVEDHYASHHDTSYIQVGTGECDYVDICVDGPQCY